MLVENGIIKEIGRAIEAGDAEIIDATPHRDARLHRHAPARLGDPVRGILPSCTLDQYLSEGARQLRHPVSPRGFYAANLAGALEALNAGITTLLDWSHGNNTPDHADEASAG